MNLNRIAQLPVLAAVWRARLPVISLALVYFLSFFVGIVMAHTGNKFALDRRDQLVTHGETHDAAALAFQQGRRLQAALIESRRDVLRSVRKLVEGLTVIVPYPYAVIRGWSAGIISVDSNHTSRLADPFDALYLLVYEALGFMAASLAAGGAANLTLAFLKPRPVYAGSRRLRIPTEAVRDLIRLYLLAVALIVLASFWEYFVP